MAVYKTQQPQPTSRFDTCLTTSPFVGEAVACCQQGTLVYEVGIRMARRSFRIGRDRKNDEQLVGTPDAMVPLKRRVERRRWGIALLNAMVWDP